MGFDLNLPPPSSSPSRPPSPISLFKTGDMVWAMVRSHPWWPGQIYEEALATPAARASNPGNGLLVSFFGAGGDYAWLRPSDLRPFAPHFPDLSKRSSSRKFLNAVQDAVAEVSRRAALSLTFNFSPSSVPTPGYVAVDVPGYERCDYSVLQIEEAKEGVKPGEVLGSLRQLAVKCWSEEITVDRIRSEAVLLAYRRARYERYDYAYAQLVYAETYAQLFGRYGRYSLEPSSQHCYLLQE